MPSEEPARVASSGRFGTTRRNGCCSAAAKWWRWRRKRYDTLHVLIERRGQIVEKAELMRLVWPDCTVEERSGWRATFSLLRKALGEDAETYIETVHGGGTG